MSKEPFIKAISFDYLLKNFHVPGLYRVKINSEQAAILITFNIKNRRQRRTLIEYLKRQIASGEWRGDHPQPIVFSDAKRLIDGQHRLVAISESGLVDGIWVRVETGSDDSVREYMDTGVPRSLDDRVELDEDPVVNKFASQVISCKWGLTKGTINGKPSPDDAREYFEMHKPAILWAAAVHHRERGIGQASIALAATEYYEIDPEKADEFYTDLFTPAGKVQQSQMLRDFLVREASRGGSRTVRMEFYQKAVSCMKAHFEGREIKKIIRSSGW